MATASRVIDYLFLSHPRDHGVTYLQHLYRALSLSFQMLKGGTALLIHGIVPLLFQKTGTDTINALHERVLSLLPELNEDLKTN